MKQILLTATSIIAFVLLLNVTSWSQGRFGYMNSVSLLAQMPEAKAADEAFTAYQDSLVKVGEQMAKEFQKKAEAYMAKMEAGELTPRQSQEQEGALTMERDSILAYEQEVRGFLEKRRKELFDPILQSVQLAIDEVGKENKFVIIFDSSIPNVILFAEEKEDVEALVKAKLGIQ